jgi:hypothetical protein
MTAAACGTISGYAAHRRLGQSTCRPCKDAKAEYGRQRDRRAGTCVEDGCDQAIRARGWCGKHLSRVDRHGTASDPVMPTAAEKFWPRTIPGSVPAHAPQLGPCLLWGGPVGSKGYGKFSAGRGHLWLAHRWAYINHFGPISDETPEVDHLCRVILCVQWSHLEAVTQAENLRRQHETRRAQK